MQNQTLIVSKVNLITIIFILLNCCTVDSKVPKEIIGTWHIDSTKYVSKYDETYEDLIPINLLKYLKGTTIKFSEDSIFTKIYDTRIESFEKFDQNFKYIHIKNYTIVNEILKRKNFKCYDFTTVIDGLEKVKLKYETGEVKGVFNFSNGDIIYFDKNNIIITDLINAYYLSRIK